MRSVLVLSVAFGVLISFGGSASAQISQASAARTRASAEAPVVSAPDAADYRVAFDADALDATVADGTVPRIVCRPVRGFGQLARPRTHFVRELLTSVEVM
jgi:hypothetical protein